MEITFLGTSASVPTKERNHTAVFLSYKGEGILFDCGEGTQRQLKVAGIPLAKINKILITHWHGDHMFGLPGLIQSLGLAEYDKTLEIYAPEGCKKLFDGVRNSLLLDLRVKIKFVEVSKKRFFEGEDFCLEALPLNHKIPCIGYCFIENDRRRINLKVTKKLGIPEGPLLGELQDGKAIVFNGKKVHPDDATLVVKGKKIAFITDTKLCNNAYKLAEGTDLFICEASYSSKLKDKANEYFHLTAKDAGLIANKADVKKLVLTHLSARYKDSLEIEEDARSVFDNVLCAKDFMKFNM